MRASVITAEITCFVIIIFVDALSTFLNVEIE